MKKDNTKNLRVGQLIKFTKSTKEYAGFITNIECDWQENGDRLLITICKTKNVFFHRGAKKFYTSEGNIEILNESSQKNSKANKK